MLESTIERKLKTRVEACGGMCDKFISPGKRGMPDRICLFPGGRVEFVETKAPSGKLEPLQIKRHKELRNLGFIVRVVNSEEQINAIYTP